MGRRKTGSDDLAALRRSLRALDSCLALLASVVADGKATTRIAARAGRFIDGRGETLLENVLILVEANKIPFASHA